MRVAVIWKKNQNASLLKSSTRFIRGKTVSLQMSLSCLIRANNPKLNLPTRSMKPSKSSNFPLKWLNSGLESKLRWMIRSISPSTTYKAWGKNKKCSESRRTWMAMILALKKWIRTSPTATTVTSTPKTRMSRNSTSTNK